MHTKIRFGIIGCSRIAEGSTIPAIKNSELADVIAIGSRSMEKGKQFAKKFNCQYYGSYDDILKRKEVDAVYISLPVGLHEEWVIKAAEAGKHILCEKSSTTSFESACKMVSACRQNKVRIMESFMFRFHPQHKKVIELIRDGILGKIFLFNGLYGFPSISHMDIRYNKELGGGILNDAGCYPICASRIIFEKEPVDVKCDLFMDRDKQVDIKANLCLKYDDDQFAQMTVGYDLFYQSTYSVWGSDGTLRLTRAYNIPSDMKAALILNSSKYTDEISIEPYNHYLLMVNSFCKEIIKNSSSDFNFEEDLLNQARVMEAARISSKEHRFVEILEV